MLSSDDLLFRLRRLGYRARAIGMEIVIEFDKHSRLRGSREQIERILPKLKPVANEKRQAGGQRKNKREKGNMIGVSAKIPAMSAEARGFKNMRPSRSSGGLPGLGKSR